MVIAYNRNITTGSQASLPGPALSRVAWRSLRRSPEAAEEPVAPPPPLWERPSAASHGPSAYEYSRLNPVLLYFSVQYQNAQGRTRAGAGAMMHGIRRAGGMSRVLLARALYIKVCPAFGICRGGSSVARFRTDQIELAKIAGRPAFRRSGFFLEFWRFFSRIALCSLCTIMPLRFVQVYKVFYLCEIHYL